MAQHVDILLMVDEKIFKIPEGIIEALKAHCESHEYTSKSSNNIYKPQVQVVANIEELEALEKIPEVWVINPVLFSRLEITQKHLENVKWVQCVFAGVNIIMNYLPKLRYPSVSDIPFTLTRLGGVFGKPMTEWVIGNVIAQERHFKQYHAHQKEGVWKQYLSYRMLSQLSFGIVGYGEIGQEIARTLKLGFSSKIIAYKRNYDANSNQIVQGAEYADQICGDLSSMFPQCDYVINILPSTPETLNFFTPEVFQLFDKSKKTVFINIGRGDVTSEASILYALDHGYISHAILDVFEVEPLPSHSGFWGRDDVTAIPHVSGVSQKGQVVDHFHNNFQKFIDGTPLDYSVDFEKGY